MSSQDPKADDPSQDEDLSGQESESSEPLPEIEDANIMEPVSEAQVEEDDPQLLDSASRSIESDLDGVDQSEDVDIEAVEKRTREAANKDDTSDTDAVIDEAPPDAVTDQPSIKVALDRQQTARPLIVELKRIESDVRELLQGRDNKRKRKLGGTRRWLELEEDLVAWRFGNRFDEATLARLRELVRRRHHLFNHLQFIAGTRPTWNS